MCGLAGFVGASDASVELEKVVRQMVATLWRRGPDAEGVYVAGKTALGHRRLRVIDLAGSAQPMVTRDQSLAMVFNGEIYNYRELRAVLVERGSIFQTEGDGEVILEGYRTWGDRVLDKLRGMFAFAIWDRERERLFAARDHLGVKPLYYFRNGEILAFASEMKALREHPAAPERNVDLEAVGLYLQCQFIPSPRTIWQGISKLPAAHALSFEGDRLEVWRYWSPDFKAKLDLDEANAAEQTEAALREAIMGMLVADVRLGAFLSGGLDSSLVAALMTELRGGPIETFNLGFANTSAASEHREAERVARHLGSRHHCLMIEPQQALERFDDLAEIYDEPLADTAALPTLALSALARRHVTVVLTGEGADELFSGYRNYHTRMREEYQWTRWLGSPFSPVRWLVPLLPMKARANRVLSAAAVPLAQRHVTIPKLLHEAELAGASTKAFASRLAECLSAIAGRHFEECNSADYHDRIMWVDTRLWLPDDLLTKVDRATMAHSLEARVPYLDHRFVEFAARLPCQYKQRGHERKLILRRIAAKYLPPEIIHRGKQGFVLPVKEWLAGELRGHLHEHLDRFAKRQLLRPAAIHRWFHQHLSGAKNHSFRLWALLILEKWFQRWMPDFRLD
jgi:asparagine synthase (glutamine-hydrolysing)